MSTRRGWTGKPCHPRAIWGAWKTQEQDARDVGGGDDKSVSLNPPRLFFAARESGSGTFETCRWPLTKSVIEGKADFPFTRPDFSV
jgi:hypothetical protein